MMSTDTGVNIQKIENTRKRLMYITRDDFYFLTYNTLLLLNELKCTKKSNPFIDIRKLSFAIEFISDFNLTDIILKNKPESCSPTKEERGILVNAYTRSKSRLVFIHRLITGLEKKGFLGLIQDNDKKILNVILNLKNIPTSFFDKSLFGSEINNIKKLKIVSLRIRTTSLASFLNKIFHSNGVSTWLN